jgi:hypothetical protein
MTLDIMVRADRVRLATLFQSDEEERYNLNGVFIEPAGNKGANVVATNGHILGAFHDDAARISASGIFIIPKLACAAIKASKNRDFTWLGIMAGDDVRREGRIVDSLTGGLASMEEIAEALQEPTHRAVIWSGPIEVIKAEFPSYRTIFPQEAAEAAPGAHFDTRYLALFGQVASDLGNKRGPIRVFANGALPALVECGRLDFVGVIMPCRSEVGTLIKNGAMYELPPWARGET